MFIFFNVYSDDLRAQNFAAHYVLRASELSSQTPPDQSKRESHSVHCIVICS